MDYYFVERDHRKLVQETPREEYITKINNCHSSVRKGRYEIFKRKFAHRKTIQKLHKGIVSGDFSFYTKSSGAESYVNVIRKF